MSITLRIIFALAFATSVSANAEKALPEDVIKVGYLYHFGQLTRWPDEALNGHISFCIYGDQGLGRALTELDGKAIAGRNIEISHLEKFESAKDCHVLFVRNSDLNRARLIVSSVSQLPILTVTDDERLVDAEVAIHIRNYGQRLGFRINREVASAANLTLSSRLLKLSR